MASWESCIAAISKAAGVKFSDDEAAEIIDDVRTRVERMVRYQGMGQNEAIKAATAEASDQARMAAAIERRNLLVNMSTRIDRRARIEQAAKKIGGDKPADYNNALRAEMYGINTPTRGGRFSAEGAWKTRAEEYIGGMTGDLEKAGYLHALRVGVMRHLGEKLGLTDPSGRQAFDRQWTRELYELSKDQDGKPGITGSKEALGVAQIIKKYQDRAKTNLNNAGGWIGDYQGYITKTSHDPAAIRAAGYDAWKADILKGLDLDKTFGGVADRDKFLEGTYEALTTGVHLREGTQGFKEPAFSGPGNLAKRLSQERLLHFKDADSWLDYNSKYGRTSPLESIVNSLDRAARSEALMQRWGTNPRAEFQSDLKYLSQKFRKDAASVNALKRSNQGLQNVFDFLDGTANMPHHELGAKISSTARLVESMAKLGMVAFTHLSSIPAKAAQLRYEGVGLLQGYGDAFQSMVRGRGTGETREMADLLQAGTEGMNRDILSRFEPDDTPAGTLSKLSNSFFKLSGLTYLLDAQKTGSKFVMARHLGSMIDREFGDLPEPTQRALIGFDITAKEWDALRTAPDHPQLDGRTFLTPDAALRADVTVLPKTRGLGGEAGMRNQLALKLAAYYHDVADKGVITPGIRERAILGASQPGTILGEAQRFLMQFKAWPAAAIRQGLGREIYGGQNKMAAAAGILHMALGSTITGYLAMTAKDLLKGRDPRDPTAATTWEAALMQGGGFGIMGDYLFGEFNRFGQNPAETVLGPVLGEGFTRITDIWNRMKGDAVELADGGKPKQDISSELFRTALDNLPFINLFYSRMALNYLFLWQVQEALSPGYLRRYERTVEKQNHQTFWLRPSQNQSFGR
jgi:hypothetical protein